MVTFGGARLIVAADTLAFYDQLPPRILLAAGVDYYLARKRPSRVAIIYIHVSYPLRADAR